MIVSANRVFAIRSKSGGDPEFHVFDRDEDSKKLEIP